MHGGHVRYLIQEAQHAFQGYNFGGKMSDIVVNDYAKIISMCVL